MTAAAHDESSCFHCGLALTGEVFRVVVDQVSRPTCCRGCQAVAQTIVESGLTAYYRTRSELPATPQDSRDALRGLGLYDMPEVQRSFVRSVDASAHEKEAAVLLEGITCGACVWLIEQRVARLPGVRAITVNYAARRARIRWDSRETQLSAILAAIDALGYSAQPYDGARADDGLRRERRNLLWRLFVAGFGMMQVMMYAVPVYIAEGTMTPDIEQLMRIAGLLLTAPVVAWAAMPFYVGAWREIARRRMAMDIPIAAGILAAFAASAAATLRATGDVYFDSITMFVFLLLGARWLEMGARAKASDEQERLVKLAPAFAERLDRFPGPFTPEQVPAAALRPGDLVLVRPGAAIPADGVVLDGEGSADESLLTGESRSVWKKPGARVIGGALNKHSPLVVRVERVGEESVLSGIVRLMDRAQSEKPRIALVADRAAAVFVAMVLVLSVAAAGVWYVIDPARALWITIAILVVSCPCALSLATPAALTAATGALYRQGVLVTRGHALETLAKATHYVFDKTGTLTSGEMALVGVIPLGEHSVNACLRFAAALEASSEHPIGKAIVEAARGHGGNAAVAAANVPGGGVEGRVDGMRLRIGTAQFVGALHGLPPPDVLALVSDEVTAVVLGDERGWIAVLTLGDTVRRDARRLVADLHARGATVCMLSGDRPARVQRLAAELGIRVARGGATPEYKVAFVRALQREGAVVAMIGDGVNDAPVLAQAQVSVALSSGADLAQASADVVLVGDRLAPLRVAAAQARRTMRVVRQNLAWATLYNAVALPLAAAGLVTPLIAAIGMSASSLVVVVNALRLVRAEGGIDTDQDRHRRLVAQSG